MFTLSWLFLFVLAGGVLAAIDGILRLRGRGTSIIGVIELIAAGLLVLSLFLPGIPFGTLTLAIITIIVLVIALILGRGRSAISIIGLVLLAAYIVLFLGWIRIPGVN